MLTGKDLIIATKDFTGENRAKSWLYTISTLLILIGTYTAGVLSDNLWIKTFFGILSGLVAVRMFVIYHDYVHKTILQKSKLAEAIFYTFGLFILASVSIWRRSHDYHHQHNSKLYTSSIGSFPIVTREKYLSAPKSERFTYLFIRHPLTIGLGYIFAFLYGMSIRSLINSPGKHWDSALAIIFHYSIGAWIYFQFGLSSFLLSFLLPAFISSAIGSYLFYAQHNFPGVEFNNKENWNYYEAAMKSSSYMVMSPLMQWFTANIGFHHIHHINARIPFYRLPETFNHFKEFQCAKQTSLKPWDIWACFRLKVWDPELNRMISLHELRS